MWIRYIVLMGLVCTCALALLDCQRSQVWSPPDNPRNSCDPTQPKIAEHPDWKRFLDASQKMGAADVCLQVAWGTPPAVNTRTKQMRLSPKGELRPYVDGDTSSIPLPPAAQSKPLRFRIFVFHPEYPEDKRAALCQTSMTSAGYDCLKQEKQRECLLQYEFHPDGNKKRFIPFSDPNASGCQLSLRDAGTPDTAPPDTADVPCTPGKKRACYPGPAAVRGKGRCREGEQLCLPSKKWGPCLQARLPIKEHCDYRDHDCDGKPDSPNCIDAWISRAGDVGYEIVPGGFTINSKKELIVVGHIAQGNDARFGPFTFRAEAYDLFVAKLSPKGEWLALAHNDGTREENQEAKGVAIDPRDDAIIIVGTYYRNLVLGDIVFTAKQGVFPSDRNFPSTFIAKLDPTMKKWLWAAQLDSTNAEYCSQIIVHDKGEMTVACTAHNDITTTPMEQLMYEHSDGSKTKIPHKDNSRAIMMLLRLDANGKLLKSHVFGELSQSQKEELRSRRGIYHQLSMHKGPGNDLIIIGDFIQQPSGFKETAKGRSNTFIGRMDASYEWVWLKYLPSSSEGLNNPMAITKGPQGYFYIVGNFTERLTIGANELRAEGKSDIFVAKIDVDGNWLWAVSAGGRGLDQAWDIKVNDKGECFITGQTTGTALVGGQTLKATDPIPQGSFFFGKLNPDATWQWAFHDGNGHQTTGKYLLIEGNDVFITGSFTGIQMGTWLVFPDGATNDLFVGKNLQTIYGKP